VTSNGGPRPLGGPAIRASGITKRYGHRLVLKRVDLTLESGERLAIFGPNGAGKTTLLRILATAVTPTAGEIEVAGIDPRDDPVEARRHLGVMSHQPYLYPDLTARENLRFYGRMYDVRGLEARVEAVAKQVGLLARLDDRVVTFSHGMRQRIAMARAVLHDPELLLLDEPEAGLDQDARNLMASLLDAQVDGHMRSAVIVTHQIELGLALSQRVAILVDGRIAFQAPSSELDPATVRQHYRTRPPTSQGSAAPLPPGSEA